MCTLDGFGYSMEKNRQKMVYGGPHMMGCKAVKVLEYF